MSAHFFAVIIADMERTKTVVRVAIRTSLSRTRPSAIRAKVHRTKFTRPIVV
jgi:hypothetical protein